MCGVDIFCYSRQNDVNSLSTCYNKYILITIHSILCSWLREKWFEALSSTNFGVWVVFFTAAVSKHVGAKHVLNMVIPDGETEGEMNKRISDYGDTNDLL